MALRSVPRSFICFIDRLDNHADYTVKDLICLMPMLKNFYVYTCEISSRRRSFWFRSAAFRVSCDFLSRDLLHGFIAAGVELQDVDCSAVVMVLFIRLLLRSWPFPAVA